MPNNRHIYHLYNSCYAAYGNESKGKLKNVNNQ